MTIRTQCAHLLVNPYQPQATIRESDAIHHDCAVCTAQRLTTLLQDGIPPAKVAWMVSLKECPHYRAGARCCLPCWLGVAGAVLLLWSSTRVQTKQSTTVANRQMRLLHLLSKQCGRVDALMRPGKCDGARRTREKAILPSSRWEKRGGIRPCN
jgi:hypothetical protein